MTPPVLLVHGIWDDGARFGPMRAALERAGHGPTAALDLSPNDGSCVVERMAEQVDRAAAELLAGAGASTLDLVGFSMGALVSRYWVQRMGGKERTRKFVSISGPHHGTATAFARSLPGVLQMRPKSPLLAALRADRRPWGDVEVHTMWTPYDLMIVPARSSQLPKVAADHCMRIALHRWMVTHPRAIAEVVSILAG
jgi:triacylglycerol esterase/lipase EstA (alpha/beta hydrolase family)